MKAILCLALIAACAFAVDPKFRQTAFIQTESRFNSQLEKVKQNEMGALLMDLAQIHMATEGPLEDLVQALNDLIADTQGALDSENSNFVAATEAHDNAVSRWGALISSAESDIASTESILADILRPRKASLEDTIANLEHAIEENIATTQRESNERATAHDLWVAKDAEYSLAIDACREALTLLNQLKNGEVALAQVRVAQQAMKKVQEKVAKLSNNKIGTFLKALTSVAQNFANQEVVVRVISLVENLLANCIAGQEELRTAEEAAAHTWANDRLPWLQQELASLQGALAENQAALESTNSEIADKEHFLSSRKNDLTQFTESLAAENAAWEVVVSTHTTTVTRLTTELEGAHQAADIIGSANFSRYIEGHVNRL
jgi:hypothetical protein